MKNSSFGEFVANYDREMGDNGDYTHQNTIDPALFKTLGNVRGKVIYDIGCGNGYITRKFVRLGAKEVWASDISPEMISLAKNKYDRTGIKYLVRNGTNFKDIPKNYFDLVVMNMVIHYLSGLDQFFENVSLSLKMGGRFVFTTDHPFHSLSYMDIEKITDFNEVMEDARSYATETVKEFPNHWDKEKRLKVYHRPFGMYINLLSKNGLLVDGLIEPPTKRTVSYGDNTPLFSPIPFKFALGATMVKRMKD